MAKAVRRHPSVRFPDLFDWRDSNPAGKQIAQMLERGIRSSTGPLILP